MKMRTLTLNRQSPPMSGGRNRFLLLLVWLILAVHLTAAQTPHISGELKQWHKVTLTLDGPAARETDLNPNPFTDYRMTVTFTHESGTPSYQVPGYFAADGNAANTSADSGNQWRAHLSPDKPGQWTYRVSFLKGRQIALEAQTNGEPVANCDGQSGRFTIASTDKSGRDFRGKGRLQYVGKRYLQFAGTKEFFLKAGADAPENLLAFADFDGTRSNKKPDSVRPGESIPNGLKTWQPHVPDWLPGNPTWKDGRGKGLIGALNYLAGKGCNAFSFLTYNAGGDGDDVWPFRERDDKLYYDCSKLDQWQIVFDHATQLGLYCHFKTQETENDDLKGPGAAQSLDGGNLGPERKLYYRELIARFGHLLALNWNLGEENTQTTEQQRAMAQFFFDIDPYHHHIVIHTYPNEQDKVYAGLLGSQSKLTGASLQNSWQAAHQRVLKWVTESEQTGRPWVVANDEQNPAGLGVPPDPGYQGFDGMAKEKEQDKPYDLHDIRKSTLWGTLMAGGQGVEYYFGYRLPENDLKCEDFRSRDRSWDYCRIVLEFFRANAIPFWEMKSADALVGNTTNDNRRYCLAKPGRIYVVYLPDSGATDLDLSGANGIFRIKWFNPRTGGLLQDGPVKQAQGGARVALGQPPSDSHLDWTVLVTQSSDEPNAADANAPKKPNILWLIAEDMGPEALSCSGTPQVWTPNIDQLARDGVRYRRAYTTAPVCSPSRSAFMTGMYATTLGAHNHRSHRGDGFQLPAGVRVLTDWLRDVGYFTANIVNLPATCGFKGTDKTDWNFEHQGKPFDSANWDDLKLHQPFYAQINFSETHRTFHGPAKADPAKVVIPPYYPDDPITRKDWAQYLDSASELDRKIGLVLQQLAADGLADNTVVVFFGDNGQAHVRGKQFCYEEGLHVPLVIRWANKLPAPQQIKPGDVNDRFIEAIDLAPTMLAIAGARKPAKMQGRIFLGDQAEAPREFAFGARDRCDETVMRIRTVRDARYRFIANFTPNTPLLAPNAYKEKQYPVWNHLKELHAQGKLTPVQDFLCQPVMPPEELYDLDTDPHEIHNLAKSDEPAHQAALKRLRNVLNQWIRETDDQGRNFESAEVVARNQAKQTAPQPKNKKKAMK